MAARQHILKSKYESKCNRFDLCFVSFGLLFAAPFIVIAAMLHLVTLHTAAEHFYWTIDAFVVILSIFLFYGIFVAHAVFPFNKVIMFIFSHPAAMWWTCPRLNPLCVEILLKFYWQWVYRESRTVREKCTDRNDSQTHISHYVRMIWSKTLIPFIRLSQLIWDLVRISCDGPKKKAHISRKHFIQCM